MKFKQSMAFILLIVIILPALLIAENKDMEVSDALILVDESEMEIQDHSKAKFKRRIVIQVLSEAGKEVGYVTLSENNFVKVGKIKAEIRYTDGKVLRKLKKSEIFEQMYTPGFILYNDTKYKFFRIDWPKTPYVLEFSYELEINTLTHWPGWYPQDQYPVMKSSYKLVLKEQIPFKRYAIGLEDKPQILTDSKYKTYYWKLTNLPKAIDENWQPPETEIQKKLIFAPLATDYGDYPVSLKSWDSFANWYNRLCEGRDVLSPEAKEKVRQITAQAATPGEKIQALYSFLQDYTRYVAIYLGIGGVQPHSAESIFQNRYGDCKDLSILMKAMLSEAGIHSQQVLMKTRDDGVVYPDFVVDQFNHALLMVPLQPDTIWLECTAKYCNAGDLNWTREGCNVLVMRENGGDIVQTPISRAEDNFSKTVITGEISQIGDFTFCGSLTIIGNRAISYRYACNEQKATDLKHWLGSKLGIYQPALTLDSYELVNCDKNFDQPLEIHFTGTIKKCASRSANRLFLNPNIFNRIEADEIPREKDRKFPVFYYNAYSEFDSVSIKIPEHYLLEAAVAADTLETAFGQMKTACKFENGQLTYCRTLKIRRRMIPIEDYEEYTDFMTRAARLDKSKFVFKK